MFTSVYNWLDNNKEWFLSGAGILIITSVCSIISIIGTLVIKNRQERKSKKKIKMDISYKELSLPKIDSKLKELDVLDVSYKGTKYNNLCYVTIKLTNIGLIAVENHNILISFPLETCFIEERIIPSNSTIKIVDQTKEELNDKIECTKKINRLEPNDFVEYIYMIDSIEYREVNAQVRGVDNLEVEYTGKNMLGHNLDIIEFIARALALFIVFDTIPIAGNYLKALTILFSYNKVKDIVIILYNRRKSSNALVINSMNIREGSVCKINNK